MAVGDLDKIPDANGANHDEVVVAYAIDLPPDSPNGPYGVNLAVLNYTTSTGSTQPLYQTLITVPGLYLDANSGSSRVISVAIGDFDGDGQNEIALATAVKKYVTENGVTTSDTVELSLFRYVHNSLTDTPSLKLVSSTDLLVSSTIPPSISLVARISRGQPTIRPN